MLIDSSSLRTSYGNRYSLSNFLNYNVFRFSQTITVVFYHLIKINSIFSVQNAILSRSLLNSVYRTVSANALKKKAAIIRPMNTLDLIESDLDNFIPEHTLPTA